MNKLRQSVEKALARAKEKRGRASVATIRQDVVKRAVERGDHLGIRRAYSYTDDYAWDATNDYGRNDNVPAEGLLREYEILTPSCWVDPNPKEWRGFMCYEVSVSFHSNLAYDVYVPVTTKSEEATA